MHSTPKTIKAYDKAYRIKRDLSDAEAHKNGEYIFEAFQSALNNMFRKKGQKPKGYLDVAKKPIFQRTEQEEQEGLTEEEKRKRTEMFFTNLEIQMANFNLAKGKENAEC